jgi:hypothetical protein
MELIKGLAAFFNLNKEANDKYVYITNLYLAVFKQVVVADLLKNKEHLTLDPLGAEFLLPPIFFIYKNIFL